MTDTFRKEYNDDADLKEFANKLKDLAESLAAHVNELDNSREKSIALTKLEESVMWAVKAVYTPASSD